MSIGKRTANKTDKINMEAYGLCGQYEQLAQNEIIGRIVSQEKGLYCMVSENGEKLAEISGKLRQALSDISDYPAVGDFVSAYCPDELSHAVIHSVLQRKSVFVRKAAGEKSRAQVMAANIDTVFICMSLNGDFNVRRLERYLSAAWNSGAMPVVLLTKSDLCSDIEKYKILAEEAALGVDIVAISDREDVRENLLPYLGFGKTVALVGSSGVGKSTIINRLLGENRIETNGLRNDDKGRHTTTRRELFLLGNDGMIIDTPGMRELGLWNAEDGFDKSFSDIEKLSKKCRFSDCTHTNEPNCAVIRAMSEGVISKERLMSFQKLKLENAYSENTSEYLEEKKRKFKNIAKINKTRKY